MILFWFYNEHDSGLVWHALIVLVLYHLQLLIPVLVRRCHRVYRVTRFPSSRRIWAPCSPSLGQRGRHNLLRWRGWGTKFRRRNRLSDTLGTVYTKLASVDDGSPVVWYCLDLLVWFGYWWWFLFGFVSTMILVWSGMMAFWHSLVWLSWWFWFG
jgi:hypothetical protein